VLEVGEGKGLSLGDRAERDRVGLVGEPDAGAAASSTINRTPYSALVENSIRSKILPHRSDKGGPAAATRELGLMDHIDA
jgi:hypothetical protein